MNSVNPYGILLVLSIYHIDKRLTSVNVTGTFAALTTLLIHVTIPSMMSKSSYLVINADTSSGLGLLSISLGLNADLSMFIAIVVLL